MTNGVDQLKVVLIGQETTAGHAGSAVAVHWRGEGAFADLRKTEFPNEHVGLFGGANRSYVAVLGSEIPLTGDASFEQAPYIWDAAFAKATPAQDGTSSGYVRSYAMPITGSDKIARTDLATLIVEAGDNMRRREAQFGFVREWTLSGAAKESWKISATVEMRELTRVTVPATGMLLPDIEEALFLNTLLYIDPVTSSAGTSLKSDTLLSASLQVTTGWQAKFTGSGRLDFSDVKFVGGEGTLEITFEHETTADSEKEAWENQTERVIRLWIPGSAYTTAGIGGTYTGKVHVVDCYGKWSSFAPLGESDGNTVSTGTFRIATVTSVMKRLEIITVNEVSALP